MRKVTVTASKEYDVYIDGGILRTMGERVRETCGGETVCLVTDTVVDGLYGDAAMESLSSAGYKTVKFVIKAGERSKTIDTYASLIKALAEARLTRTDTVAALGGGVVGDLAGFAAATYLRGVKLAQIPTTLLAMVDSSVGGKTAVDIEAGKNLVGAFYQPDIVLCDTQTLNTLPDVTFRDGCAEMIKHGVIRSESLFDALKEPVSNNMEDIIAQNVGIKRDVVAADEREGGIRRILNFGHTIGHGIEKHSRYTVTHGSAVAIGMVAAGAAAWRMGICGEECHGEITRAVRRYGLPTKTDIPPERLIDAILFDKKRDGQRITLILPEKIGKCVEKSFTLDEAAEVLKAGMAQ